MLHEAVHGGAALQAGAGDGQRHPYRGVVVALALAGEAVVEQQLAVVCHQDEVGVIEPAALLQGVHHAAELVVEVAQVGEVVVAGAAPVLRDGAPGALAGGEALWRQRIAHPLNRGRRR